MLLLNIILGLLFLALAIANTLLMYHLWGYPYDYERHRSPARRAGSCASIAPPAAPIWRSISS